MHSNWPKPMMLLAFQSTAWIFLMSPFLHAAAMLESPIATTVKNDLLVALPTFSFDMSADVEVTAIGTWTFVITVPTGWIVAQPARSAPARIGRSIFFMIVFLFRVFSLRNWNISIDFKN